MKNKMNNNSGTFTKDFYLFLERDENHNFDEVEITVTIKFSFYREDSHRFGRGPLCIDPEEITWNKIGFSNQEIAEVEKKIDAKLEDWIEEL